VAKNEDEAMRLMGKAATAGNLDAMVEFAIAEFNGTHTKKDEAGAVVLFEKASRRGSAIAQNRLARILSAGKGAPADPVEAMKWHIVSKAGGASDPELDIYTSKQKPSDREKAEALAKKWLASADGHQP
jgi:TPR repeat protein